MSHHLYPNHPLRGVCVATVGGSEWGGSESECKGCGLCIAIPKPLYCFIFEGGGTPRCVLPAFPLELLE